MIDVTAAIIEKDSRILIAQRAAGKHLEHKWEFPGGKIEPGETPEVCLARELKEEFGITAEIKEFVAESVFSYGEKTIRLLGYRAKYVHGEFSLAVHEAIAWVRPDELMEFDLAPADIPIARALTTSLRKHPKTR